MSSLPVSQVKARLAEVIDSTRETGEPVVITQNGQATAVLQDLESYESMRRSLAMLKLVAQGERDVSRGKVKSHAAVFRALKRRLGSK